MQNGLLILTLLVVFICILAGIAAFAGRRRLLSKKMVVKNLQNPNNPVERYYAIYDKNKDMLFLYSNLFKPFKNSIEPPFNLKAYMEDGIIKAVRGGTGNPEDRNITPVRSWPIVGKTGSREFSRELAGAVVNTEQFIALCKPFRVGQEVEFIDKHKGKDVNIRGQIVRIGYEGIVLAYDIPFTTPEGMATTKKVEMPLEEHSQIAKLRSISDAETVARLHETPLLNFFDENWVMTNFGVVPVDDVNAVLESEKSMVAQYNSNIDSRRMERMSWAARHGPELLIITFFAVSVVLSILYWNSIDALITSHVNTALGVATTHNSNNIITNILPKPTTGVS
jgi:hypothetical protein